MNKREKKAFEQAKVKADEVLQDKKRMQSLKQAVEGKIKKSQHRLKEGLDDLYTLLRLLAAYASGEYRRIPVKVMLSVVAVLIYFLNPMDIIPDFITAFGFIDDLAILAYVIRTFRTELEEFAEWEMKGEDVADEV